LNNRLRVQIMKSVTAVFLILLSAFLFTSNDLIATDFGPSVSYTRTQSRAATVDSIDAVYYNPAGLARLKNGFHLDAGYQVMTKTAAYDIAFTSGEDTAPSWFIPNFAAVYKQGKGAIFLSLHMPEGVEFTEYRKPYGGMALVSFFALDLDPLQMAALRSAGLTQNLGGLELPVVSYVKASRYWLQGRLGGSFALNETIAFAGGFACSYYHADRSAGVFKGGTVDKLEKKAVGWSGFAGLLVGPADRFVVSVLYATQTVARGTEKNVKYHYTRIMERRLPDSLIVGMNFKTADKASIQLSYQVDFTGEKKYGTRNILTRDHEFGFMDWAFVAQNASALALLPLISSGNAQNYKHKNRHSIGLGLEFGIGGFVPSVGLSCTTQEKYPRAQNPLDPDLIRVGFGSGLKASAGDNLILETGSAYYFYVTDRMLYNSTKLNRSAWTWGFNVTYKVL